MDHGKVPPFCSHKPRCFPDLMCHCIIWPTRTPRHIRRLTTPKPNQNRRIYTTAKFPSTGKPHQTQPKNQLPKKNGGKLFQEEGWKTEVLSGFFIKNFFGGVQSWKWKRLAGLVCHPPRMQSWPRGAPIHHQKGLGESNFEPHKAPVEPGIGGWGGF